MKVLCGTAQYFSFDNTYKRRTVYERIYDFYCIKKYYSKRRITCK